MTAPHSLQLAMNMLDTSQQLQQVLTLTAPNEPLRPSLTKSARSASPKERLTLRLCWAPISLHINNFPRAFVGQCVHSSLLCYSTNPSKASCRWQFLSVWFLSWVEQGELVHWEWVTPKTTGPRNGSSWGWGPREQLTARDMESGGELLGVTHTAHWKSCSVLPVATWVQLPGELWGPYELIATGTRAPGLWPLKELHSAESWFLSELSQRTVSWLVILTFTHNMLVRSHWGHIFPAMDRLFSFKIQ